MKCLSFILPADAGDAPDLNVIVERARAAGRYPEVERPGRPGEPQLLHFFTDDAPRAWAELRAALLGDDALGRALAAMAVVVCVDETSEDEDSERLLFHHDASQPIVPP